uniref:MORN repeat-containing protein 3 n=2 Tax=Lygus hesperus TaxID=30085 RepID=A0A0A9VYX7_LYGHE
MAYDCRFQATLKDHIPVEYLRYISKEGKAQVKLPDEKQMFVKKCMVPALYRTIPPSPTSKLMERVKRNGLKHSIFNADRDVYVGEWKNDGKEGHGSFKTRSGKVLYEGEWVNGKAEGYGVLCHQGDHKRYNIHYEGFWKNGKPQAKGYNHYKDGSYYKGGWANGARNGYGQMWYANKHTTKGIFTTINTMEEDCLYTVRR